MGVPYFIQVHRIRLPELAPPRRDERGPARRRARAGVARDGWFPLVCTHAPLPSARSEAETLQGGTLEWLTLIQVIRRTTSTL